MVSTKTITNFLSLILMLNIVITFNLVFNCKHYFQTMDCAMGTICAPSYANICRAMNKAFTLALCKLSLWLLADMEISKFVQFHGYLSSVSVRLQMVYPNTRSSWFTRQLDLKLMFTSIISFRTANWIKWEKLFTDLLVLSTGSTYSLALFIRFGGLIYSIQWLDLLALFSGFIYSLAVFIRLDGSAHWIYLLDLFIGLTYSLALYVRFGGFIYLPFLWTLVSAYTVFMLIANSVSFSHISERNTSTFLSIYISHVLMEKVFCSPLRHHSCLIKLTLLQLHHHTLLIKLTNVAS